jgi:preprotein translocase subunit SecE
VSDSRGTATGPGSLGDEPGADRDALAGSARLEPEDDAAELDRDRYDGDLHDDLADGDDLDGDLDDDLDGDRYDGELADEDELDGDLDDVREPAAAGSVAVAGSTSRAAVPRTARTPARTRRGPVTRVRSIGTFYRQVVAELRKVIWPTRQELVTYTSVVIVFVVVMVTIVSIFDFAFSQAVLRVFGNA